MRVAFFGTPQYAVPTLDALIDAGHEVVTVVAQPDKRRGRSSQPAAMLPLHFYRRVDASLSFARHSNAGQPYGANPTRHGFKQLHMAEISLLADESTRWLFSAPCG